MFEPLPRPTPHRARPWTSLVVAATAASVLAAVGTVVMRSGPEPVAPEPAHALRLSDDFGHGRLPIVWDPCSGPISYKLNLDTIADRAERVEAAAETAVAFERLADLTGLSFRYAGQTGTVPSQDGRGHPGAIVVAFATEADTDLDVGHDDTFGVGGSTYERKAYTDQNGRLVARSEFGFVVIDHHTTVTLPRDSASAGATRPNLLVHELGHVVGLEHVPEPQQLMHTYLTDATPSMPFSPGDRRGFDAVGAKGGCLSPFG